MEKCRKISEICHFGIKFLYTTQNGRGLPEGFRPGRSGLGTQIVRAFVQDLKGTISWEARPEGGTRVCFTARLRGTAHASAG